MNNLNLKNQKDNLINGNSNQHIEYFVDKDSIVRQIWGKSDTILFIFAGAAAEFALNKAVDWLYFTGRLPVDPLGRLFSTVYYAQAIIFSEKQIAMQAIDSMSAIHSNVERKREAKIPDWAYRDVLFMLIDYSIRSYEILERNLAYREKEEVFQVFIKLGERMGLNGLPENFEQWKKCRHQHLTENLQRSNFTDDLFRQYRKHLGLIRYTILLDAQSLLLPSIVNEKLGIKRTPIIRPLLSIYKFCRNFKLEWILKDAILPSKYKKEIQMLGT